MANYRITGYGKKWRIYDGINLATDHVFKSKRDAELVIRLVGDSGDFDTAIKRAFGG